MLALLGVLLLLMGNNLISHTLQILVIPSTLGLAFVNTSVIRK